MSGTDPHRHHHRDTLLTLRRPDGTPMAEAEVTFAQRSHAFAFANIGHDFVGLANDEDPMTVGSDVFGGADPASARELADL